LEKLVSTQQLCFLNIFNRVCDFSVGLTGCGYVISYFKHPKEKFATLILFRVLFSKLKGGSYLIDVTGFLKIKMKFSAYKLTSRT